MATVKYNFGNIVIIEEGLIGVIVKCWADDTYEVYVREYNGVGTYNSGEIRHYIFSKAIPENEKQFYDWG